MCIRLSRLVHLEYVLFAILFFALDGDDNGPINNAGVIDSHALSNTQSTIRVGERVLSSFRPDDKDPRMDHRKVICVRLPT